MAQSGALKDSRGRPIPVSGNAVKDNLAEDDAAKLVESYLEGERESLKVSFQAENFGEENYYEAVVQEARDEIYERRGFWDALGVTALAFSISGVTGFLGYSQGSPDIYAGFFGLSAMSFLAAHTYAADAYVKSQQELSELENLLEVEDKGDERYLVLEPRESSSSV